MSCSKFYNVFSNVVRSAFLIPKSTIFLSKEVDNWSLFWDVHYVHKILIDAGLRSEVCFDIGLLRQTIFYVNKYILLKPRLRLHGMNTVTMAYYHGYPGTGCNESDGCFASLEKYHQRIGRIQYTHQRMGDYLLEAGVPQWKLRKIYIGVDDKHFSPVSDGRKKEIRCKLGIPESAIVVGSFQKDGQGWGDGTEPKLIKGPDIFVDTMRMLKGLVPELHVLLTGPARGFVKAGLSASGIPHTHLCLDRYHDLPELYNALDLYLVSSREEGGPKAVLESMASGVPLVSTPVGQAVELICPEVNGLLSTGFSPEELSSLCYKGIGDVALRKQMVESGIHTAGLNTYASQTELWLDFFEGIEVD